MRALNSVIYKVSRSQVLGAVHKNVSPPSAENKVAPANEVVGMALMHACRLPSNAA